MGVPFKYFVILIYYMTTIVRPLWLAAEWALFSCNDRALSGVSLRIGETGEYWKVTGELLWKGKALSGNKQNLAGEFCVVRGEFSDLRCLMNTLHYETFLGSFELRVKATIAIARSIHQGKASVWDFPVMTSLSVNKWYVHLIYLFIKDLYPAWVH